MEYVNKLDEYPKDLFSKSFEEMIDKTKILFKDHEEHIKSLIKCCFLGNTSTGKSTVMNVLLDTDILYEGIPEATLCVAKCQLSKNNDEYFEIYTGNVCPNKPKQLSEIKDVNKTNIDYSKLSMDLNNYLDIFLNIPNNKILQNFMLIDCPGFDNNNLDAISKYCKYADIIIFCFSAKEGITDNDIDKIIKIKEKIGKFQISFIINFCDKVESIDNDGIINKLSPHLTGENAIYFMSAFEEKAKMLNNATSQEFERFKQCLRTQESGEVNTFKKVYSDLICSIKKLLDCLGITKNISEISNVIIKQFINDYNLNDGIINDNVFYQLLIDKEPNSSWYEYSDNIKNMKLSILLSILEENVRMLLNDRRHGEFERFKQCLQRQKSLATVTYRKVHGDLLFDVTKLLEGLNLTDFRESRFSESLFEDLREQIIQLISNDKTKYKKDAVKDAILSYSSQTNKEISKFMMKQFIIDYNLNDGNFNENYFFKRFIQNDTIQEPHFNFFDWFNQNKKMKKSFIDHFNANLTTNQQCIAQSYIERVKSILEELEKYKGKLNEIIENIRNLMF